jgi:hypothetical protein
MNDLNLQTHEIAVYINQKRLMLLTSIMALLCLLIGGMDVFALWAFWNHYEIDTGAYVAAVILSIGTATMGWFLFVMLYTLRQRGPAITINSEGFSFAIPLHFAFVSQFRQSFIPWEEIEWIASSQQGMYTWLSLSLKDPAHYWSLYGHGPFRSWRRDALTGAHINVAQYTLSLSAGQILQQIEENYSSELLKYEIKMRC